LAEQNSGPLGEFDLLGDPVRDIRDPRGRPSYAKTKENQLLVIQFRAVGWSHEQIATFMGCDAKTLRKHFSRELDNGALFLEGMAMQALVKQMLTGNVGATKKVLEISQATNAPRGKAPKEAEAKAPKLGKKEQIAGEARTPPLGWGEVLQ
jgi:hypothetical protein